MADSEIILGISLGTKSIGVAVVQKNYLVIWQIKTFKGKWSAAKLKTITQTIQRVVEDNKVTIIALKEPHFARSSKGIRQLTAALSKLLTRTIKIQSYSLLKLKKYCAQENKSGLAVYVTLKYPHLATEYRKEQRNRNVYYLKMFEAIVVAELASHSIAEKKTLK